MPFPCRFSLIANKICRLFIYLIVHFLDWYLKTLESESSLKSYLQKKIGIILFFFFFSFKIYFLWFVFTEKIYVYTHPADRKGKKMLYSSMVCDAILGALNESLDTFATFAEKVVKEMAQGMFSPVTNTRDLSLFYSVKLHFILWNMGPEAAAGVNQHHPSEEIKEMPLCIISCILTWVFKLGYYG